MRIFYQSALGFEPKRYVDVGIKGQQICATDLDKDGCAELIVRDARGAVSVLWGEPGKRLSTCLGPEISLDIVPVANDATDLGRPQDQDVRYEEYVEDAKPLVRLLPVDVILGRGGFFVEIV